MNPAFLLLEWVGMKIIGLSGTNGSGKDTVGHILADQYNYLFISVTDLLRDEARSRGQEPAREVLRTISAEWRRESGSLGVLIDKAVEQYKEVENEYPGGLVVASLRNPGEADRVHELSGTVIWVDADPQVRYDRITANAVARNRAEEDNKTFEQFQAEEAVEMTSSGDSATLNMSAVKEKSDIILMNHEKNISDFTDLIERTLTAQGIL